MFLKGFSLSDTNKEYSTSIKFHLTLSSSPRQNQITFYFAFVVSVIHQMNFIEVTLTFKYSIAGTIF
jgi:hypothetical protein